MPLIVPGLEVLVLSGDVLSGLTVGDAGAYAAEIVVESGGTVIDTGISTSGYLELDPGAVAIGVVDSGGKVFVSNGGTAIGDDVVSGGHELVQSGGLATGVDLYGGTLEVASGGLMSGQLTFGQDSAGSTLVLDAGASLNALVAGFGTFEPGYGVGVKPDKIDLQGIAFGTTKKSQVSFTEAAGNLSGTLTVTDGVHTASIQAAWPIHGERVRRGKRRTRRHAHHLHIGDAARGPPRPRQRDRSAGHVLTGRGVIRPHGAGMRER